MRPPLTCPKHPPNCCSSTSFSCWPVKAWVTTRLLNGWTVKASPKLICPGASPHAELSKTRSARVHQRDLGARRRGVGELGVGDHVPEWCLPGGGRPPGDVRGDRADHPVGDRRHRGSVFVCDLLGL